MFRKTAFAVAMAASVFAATAVQAHPKLTVDVAYLQHEELEATYLVSAVVGF